uniref:Uncharacterized protein n=1 Tax=Anguilla anguilla TaxID=7936 RepID=A0A0E9RYQ6_ANGAN
MHKCKSGEGIFACRHLDHFKAITRVGMRD